MSQTEQRTEAWPLLHGDETGTTSARLPLAICWTIWAAIPLACWVFLLAIFF